MKLLHAMVSKHAFGTSCCLTMYLCLCRCFTAHLKGNGNKNLIHLIWKRSENNMYKFITKFLYLFYFWRYSHLNERTVRSIMFISHIHEYKNEEIRQIEIILHVATRQSGIYLVRTHCEYPFMIYPVCENAYCNFRRLQFSKFRMGSNWKRQLS